MKNAVSVAKWSSLLIGILALILGFVSIFNPLETSVTLVYVIGFLFILAGIVTIVRYFQTSWFRSGAFMVGGVLSILMGIIMLRHTTASTIALTYLIGFWVLVQGIIDIATSFDLKKFGLSTWWLTLISGILGIIFGIMLLGNFGLAVIYVTVLISIYFFAAGISLITMFFSLSNLQKRGR